MRATPPSPRRCGRPTPRCCTTGPAGSTAPAPASARHRPRARRAARGGRVRRRADRGRTAQGVRPRRAGHHPADIHDRLAPAPRRSASRWASAGRRSWACHARGRATRSWSPRSATPRPTTPPPSARSTPPATPSYQGIPVPLLFVCEDNGIGISVPTPRGWVAAAYGERPGLRYLAADGSDPVAAYDAAAEAAGVAGSGGARCSCTCPRSGSWATPAATRRPPTVAPADARRGPRPRSAAGDRGRAGRAGLLTPGEAVARYDRDRRPGPRDRPNRRWPAGRCPAPRR